MKPKYGKLLSSIAFDFNLCRYNLGSYVDDVLAAQGLPNPPLIQKIFWAFTEGAVVGGRCRLTR